jgi:hypothetical protein
VTNTGSSTLRAGLKYRRVVQFFWNSKDKYHWKWEFLKRKEYIKGKAVPMHVMKVYRERRGIALLILKLGASWRFVVSITPRSLCFPENNPSTHWIVFPTRMRTPDRPIVRVIHQPTRLIFGARQVAAVKLRISQKTLNTNKCTKIFFVNYNTLLHVSTLLGQPRPQRVHASISGAVHIQQHILAQLYSAI